MRRLTLLLVLSACGPSPARTPAPPTPTPPAATAMAADTALDDTTLLAYLQQAFPEAIAAETLTVRRGPDESGTAVAELRAFGISTVGELAAIVPPDYAARAFEIDPTTEVGAVRDLMIIADIQRYFDQAYQDDWNGECPGVLAVPVAYGIDLRVAIDHGVCAPGEDSDNVWEDVYGGDDGDDDDGGGDGDGDDGGDGDW